MCEILALRGGAWPAAKQHGLDVVVVRQSSVSRGRSTNFKSVARCTLALNISTQAAQRACAQHHQSPSRRRKLSKKGRILLPLQNPFCKMLAARIGSKGGWCVLLCGNWGPRKRAVGRCFTILSAAKRARLRASERPQIAKQRSLKPAVHKRDPQGRGANRETHSERILVALEEYRFRQVSLIR